MTQKLSFEECPIISQQYKNAVDISSIVTKTDPSGRITYVNDQFLDISGYSRQELIGRSHNIVNHPDMDKKIFKELWKTIQKKKIWRGTIKNRSKDGSSYVVTATIIPIVDAKDEIIEYIAIRQDISDLLKQRDIIKSQTTDYLTKLPNREKLLSKLRLVNNPNFSILKINNFRDINELFGFETADKVLVFIAEHILNFFKNSKAKVFKLPSDEFAVLIDAQLDLYLFEKLITELMESIKNTEIKIYEYTVNVTLCAGITNSIINTLMYADMALQTARKNKKLYVSYDNTLDITNVLNRNLTWHNKIKQAIQNKKIIPFFQPIQNTKNKKIQKYEALVRLVDEQNNIVTPYQFLDIAKKYSQYESITKIMVQSTFEYFKDKTFDFSINISIEDILNDSIVHFITQQISYFHEPQRIIFEITESQGIENYEEVAQFIQNVRKYGCKIAIDDFGTGYSNFEHILKLKVDYLKIDGSLVKNIATQTNAKLVVETIILFAKKLKIATITEYVHNKEVYDIVQELGVDYIQGYYIGEPEQEIKKD